MFWPDHTHQSTHPHTQPPNYTPTHGWGSLHRFQIFKRNWNILISSSAIEFWLILGVPIEGVGGGWMWMGVVRGCPPHTCTCMCMHACTCMYDIIGNSKGFPQWGQPFAWNYHVYHMHMCMCAHACVRGTPNHPPPPTTHPPIPRATGSPKHQNTISLELIEIIRFCWRFFTSEHSWIHIDYSWSPQTPTIYLSHLPQSRENPNQKNYNNSWTNRDNSILFEDLLTLNPPVHI